MVGEGDRGGAEEEEGRGRSRSNQYYHEYLKTHIHGKVVMCTVVLRTCYSVYFKVYSVSYTAYRAQCMVECKVIMCSFINLSKTKNVNLKLRIN